MIVDGHVHITETVEPVWGWEPFGRDVLIELMDTAMPILGVPRRVDRAAVMPSMGLTTLPDVTFREQHRAVLDATTAYPDRLVGTFVLNPRLGLEDGIAELYRVVREDGFRMVKLHPTLHNVPLNANALVYPVLEAAVDLGIPVLIHMGEPPFALPSLAEPAAIDNPDTTIILAHLGTQKVCYADEAVQVARHCDNIYLETGWGSAPRIREAVSALGASRLVFGSDCPVQDIYSQLRPIECLTFRPPLGVGLSVGDMEKIMGGNLASLLRLDG